MKNKKTSAGNVNYIFIAVNFIALFVLNFLILYMVSLAASGSALIITLFVTAIPTFIFSLFSCMVFSKKSGDKKNTLPHCVKRMYLTIFLIFAGSLAVSYAGGMVINAIVGGIRSGVENSFVRGAILKVPMLILYLAFIYYLFVRQGYLDSEHKCFNPEFKIITFMYSFTLMLPNMIFDSIYDTDLTAPMMINVHTALSPNIDLYTFDGRLNGDFSVILVVLSIMAVLIIEFAAALFAYRRGKKLFLKEHVHYYDYATDEKDSAKQETN